MFTNQLFVILLFVILTNIIAINNRPIIGILTQPSKVRQGYAYLVASYVKYLESSGARVVPIPFDAPRSQLLDLFNSINGILFTGGGQTLTKGTTFFDNARYLWDLAIQSNDRGDYFPLWGTCQGFQMFHIFAADVPDESLVLSNFDSYYVSYPLIFNDTNVKKSRMLGPTSIATDQIRTDLATKNITLNLHHQGISPATFEKYSNMKSFLSVLSTNKDEKGNIFLSLVEAKKYPFYGSQFHPEWASFEWYDHPSVIHTEDSIRANNYFSRFFVNEARKNNHKFVNTSIESKTLIYNYSPEYTESQTKDEQTYFFKINIITLS
jgi:gamma-glutamyl hydrolase